MCFKINLSFTCIEIYSKWNKNLNLKLETLQLLKENIGDPLQNGRVDKNIFSRTLLSQELNSSISR